MTDVTALRAVVLVFASSATVSGIGLIKNVLVAYYFGTSGAMDNYLVALLLPDIAMQLARTGAFNFIPLFAASSKRSERDGWEAAGRMLTFWLVLLLVALLLAVVLAPQVLPVLAPGFSAGQREETLHLTRQLFLMAGAVGAARLLAVALHAQRRFASAAASEAVFQISSTSYLVCFHGLGIEAIVWAQIAGGFAQLATVSIALFPLRRLIRARFDLGGAPVPRLIRLSLPVYVGETGDKLNLVVTRAFASLLPTGAVSGLQYAQSLAGTVPGVLGSAVSTALFPFISHQFARDDERGARGSVTRALVSTTIVFLPVAIGLFILARPLVVILFQRGSFDATSTELTVAALQFFAPGTLAVALNGVVGSAFQARQDTLTPMKAGLARVACNTALCAALQPVMGHRGLALAATLALYVKLGLFVVWLRKIYPPDDLREARGALLRLLPVGAAMAAVLYPPSLWLVSGALDPPKAVAVLLLASALGVLVYAAALRLLCRDEFDLHVSLARRALSRRGGEPAPLEAAESET